MPRQAREVEAGFPMHVTQRGNYRQNIFHDDDDKAFYIKNFLFYRRKYKLKLYAWALMDNHIHVVIEPSSRTGLSKLFQALNTKYVFYFNKKYEISGRLFESRFFSCILNEEHFFEAIRYVELNPIRAGMEAVPGNYEWTSAKERLKLRSKYYLHKLPYFMVIDDWMTFLMEYEVDSEIWNLIREKTISTKVVGF